MARKTHGASPERSKTDDSLREERQNTDKAIRGDRNAAERKAEGVIDHARKSADALVRSERKKADRAARLPAVPLKARGVIGKRATADRAVRGERNSADSALRVDLQGRATALEALLVHERAATDAYLLTERARSDDDVSNRDDFLGMVTHDVRNLLNNVVLTLEVLQPRGGESEPHVEAAHGRIRRYVARMNRLIGDLVDVTSIDAGKLAVEPVKADAVALMAEAADTFEPAAEEKGISLIAELPRAPLPVVFDHDRILQVFANLLANAIKFTPRGGEITIGAQPVRGALRFRVSDTGVGIPKPLLKSIFERFWQVGRNDRRGMGLGLYISKCIVDAHRGRIWAESTPGKGSHFFFTLPVSAPRKRAPSPKPRTARKTGRNRK